MPMNICLGIDPNNAARAAAADEILQEAKQCVHNAAGVSHVMMGKSDYATATEMEHRDRARSDFGSRHSTRRITFGEAIHFLKQGNRVARAGWNGKNMHLELQVPDAHSKMSLPYIYMKTADGHLVPWLASQTDVLADDWSLLV